jgi:hypothetical protein
MLAKTACDTNAQALKLATITGWAPRRQTNPEAPVPLQDQALRGSTVNTRTMKACSSVM